MLTIYGHPLSVPTNKARMTANAVGANYEFTLINLQEGEQKSEKFLAINPVGQVPAIDDDGFKLVESHAISKYLARKHQSDLYPQELTAQALVDQWIDFVGNMINPAISRLFFNKIIAPRMGAPVNDDAIREGEEMAARALPIVEQQLGRHARLAGDALSLADIVLLASIDPAEIVELGLAPYPKLNDWREELRGRDFYTRLHKYYGEGMF